MYFRFSCIDSPRPDRTVQDIVYKLVPGLFKSKLIPNQSTLTTQLILRIIMNREEYPIARNIFEVEPLIYICLLTLSCIGEQKRREEFYLERGETDPGELQWFVLFNYCN